jgi:uncharacterized membrane protein YfcA
VDHQIILAMSIVFGATLIRSTFGFGEALIAMPLLTLVLGVKVAAPLVALIALASGAAILTTDWQNVEWHGAKRLIAGAMAGIPFGVYALAKVPEHYVKLVLALVVILFSLLNLARPHWRRLSDDTSAFGFGFGAGVLGGAYNTTGPLVFLFGSLRGWTPRQFRATVQSVMLPSSLVIVASHGVAGLWNMRIFRLVLCAAPVLLVTVPLGKWLNRRVHSRVFRPLLFILLLFIGGVLLVTALRGMWGE